MKASVDDRSTILRMGWWLFVALAGLAAVGLVIEAWSFFQAMPDRGWNFQVARIVGLVLLNLVFTAALASVAVMVLWSRMASGLAALQGWHVQRPESEFQASDVHANYTLDNYLEQEGRVFEELAKFVAGPWGTEVENAYSRFQLGSVCNPETITDRNWNRSLVLKAREPIGGVLLVHGLSDSPYSLRALGNRLHAEGYTVIWLRVPGHGTCPSGLAHVSQEDWRAAVQVAMFGLRDLLPQGAPLILAGYSNGGALSVDYTLSAVNDASLPKPNAVVLFSPMIGINPMASITRLYHIVALLFRNHKAQWSNISAEIDPFKYSSWPMNASVQAWAVTQAVERKLQLLEKAGRMGDMPPILAMQSVVDSTVVVPKLITALFDRLRSKSSELFLFDINRVDKIANLLSLSFEKSLIPNLTKAELPYKLTVLSNRSTDSRRVSLRTSSVDAREDIDTDMSWPDGVASLSHIALPIPPEDSVYGTSQATAGSGLPLGSLSIRAEPSALLISNSLFVRCRHNPFYQFMEDHVVQWLTEQRTRNVE